MHYYNIIRVKKGGKGEKTLSLGGVLFLRFLLFIVVPSSFLIGWFDCDEKNSASSTNVEIDIIETEPPIQDWDYRNEELNVTVKFKNASDEDCKISGNIYQVPLNGPERWLGSTEKYNISAHTSGNRTLSFQPLDDYYGELRVEVDIMNNSNIIIVSDEVKGTPHVLPGEKIELHVWAGDSQYVRPGEVLDHNSGYSCPVMIQITCNDIPVNGVPVSFNMDEYLEAYYTVNTSCNWYGINGIVLTKIKVSPNAPYGQFDITVDVADPTYNSMGSVTIPVFVTNLEEESSLLLYPHQEYHIPNHEDYTGEIPGDGYINNDENTTNKTIKLEIDYANDMFYGFDTTELFDSLANIFFTAGIIIWTDDVIFSPVIVPYSIDYDEARGLLASTRDYPDRIHVLLARGFKGESKGVSSELVGVTLPSHEDNTFRSFHAVSHHLPAVDSTGIVIFTDKIYDLIYNYSHSEGWNTTTLTAFVIAHEVGHALGMDHTDGWNIVDVMHSEILLDDYSYNQVNFFTDSTLSNSDNNSGTQYDAMNTRDVLGRDFIMNTDLR